MSDTAVENLLPVQVEVAPESKTEPKTESKTETATLPVCENESESTNAKPECEESGDRGTDAAPIKTDFFADDFFERNAWLLSYAIVWQEARIARHRRIVSLSSFIDSSLAHYEQLSGFQAPGGFQTELALQVANNVSGRKFWDYGPLADYLSERVPTSYYGQMGVTTTEELATEIRMAIEACLIWILCGNEKMRNDVAAAADYYKRHQHIEGYSRDGLYQEVNVCDISETKIVTIRLHLFPDFIPNQGNVIRQMGLVRRKGAIEYGVLGADLQGKPCYSTEYRTIAWGFRDHNNRPWFPKKVSDS